MWYCETCKNDLNVVSKSFHNKSATHIEIEVLSRGNNNLTDKTNTHLIPDFEQVYNLVKRTIDDCTRHFQRFKYISVLPIKYIHATHGTTNFSTITSKFKNQNEEVDEASN